MNTIYVARVIAMHDFGGVVSEVAFTTEAGAEFSGACALADAKANDPEWADSYRLEIAEIEFGG